MDGIIGRRVSRLIDHELSAAVAICLSRNGERTCCLLQVRSAVAHDNPVFSAVGCFLSNRFTGYLCEAS